MASNVRLRRPNRGPEKAVRNSGQGPGCGFLVMQSLRQVEERLLATSCDLELATSAEPHCGWTGLLHFGLHGQRTQQTHRKPGSETENPLKDIVCLKRCLVAEQIKRDIERHIK